MFNNKTFKLFFDLNQYKKSHYNIISTIILSVAIFGIFISIYIYFHPMKDVDYKKIKEEDFFLCSNNARDYNFFPTIDFNKNLIKLTTSNIMDFKKQFIISENIIKTCKNFELESYCIGDINKEKSCDIEGITISLKYKKPEVI